MSRKDFELIAHTLRDSYNAAQGNDNAQAVIRTVADRFASYLLATNPRFDRQGFIDAATRKE